MCVLIDDGEDCEDVGHLHLASMCNGSVVSEWCSVCNTRCRLLELSFSRIQLFVTPCTDTCVHHLHGH